MDPSMYHEVLEVPNDASIDAIEEAYRRLVEETENGKFNLNTKKRIDKLTKIRDYLVNQKKEKEKQEQLSHKAKCFIPQNTSQEQPENLIPQRNDLFLNDPTECFKKLSISENSSIETIEEKRQYYISKEREFIEKNFIISAKHLQEKIQLCDILIEYQSKNKKLEDCFIQEFNKNFDSGLELNPDAQDALLCSPSECFQKLNMPEDSSFQRIQSMRQYIVENIDSCIAHKQEFSAKYYQEKLKLCDFLIQYKTVQMKLQIQQDSIRSQEAQSEFISNDQSDPSAKYFKLFEISDNSPLEVIEKAYQRLLNESDFPWDQNSDSIDRSNILTEAYEYLKKYSFQNKENLMETDQQSETTLNAQQITSELNTNVLQTNNDNFMDYSSSEKIVHVRNVDDDMDDLLKPKIRFDNFGDKTNVNETVCNSESNINEITEAKSIENKVSEVEQTEAKTSDKELNNENLTITNANEKNPIEKDIFLSFEEIFRGLTQKVILRWMDEDKYINDEIIRIKIDPGILPNTEIPCSAQNSFQKDQTEFILVIKDAPNQKFKRLNEVDIEFTAYITKEESINGCELSIPTLENDPITMTFEDEITEDTNEEFTGRGLPLEDNKKKRGKLVVKFKISDNPNDKNCHEQSYSKEKVVIEKQISKAEKQLIAEKAKNEHQSKPEKSEIIIEKKAFVSPKVDNNTFNDSNANQTDQNNQFDQRDDGYVIINMNQAEDSYVDPENKDILSNILQESKEQLPPNKYDLNLTLEEIFRGGVKIQKIATKRTDQQGIVHQDTKTLNIEIDSKLKNGDKITFEHEGDMCCGKIAADVIFIVCEKPNSIFKRIGCDLEYVAKITQKEAILGGELIIPPLNGNKPFKWNFEGGITIGKQTTISRKELPVSSDNNQQGDLVVMFEILDMSEEETEQDEQVTYDVNITLEQILNGCNKRVKITRNIIDVDGNEQKEEKILAIDIKPGTTSGTTFTFPREGDQYPGCIPADIVFVVQDKPHELFRRIGSDIEHIMTLTKSEFNNGGKIEIPTLDGKPKQLSLDGIINEKTVRKLANCGLPISENPEKRGNLLIKFKIIEDPQDEPIVHDLELSLEEIFTGCLKQLNITRKVFDYNGNQLSSKEEPIEIVIEKGAFEGQQFIFEKYGDKNPGKTAADVIFVVHYKEHPQFKDKGYDLYYTARITESEAKSGVRLEIPTLECEPFIFKSTNRITHKDEARYPGFGLPYSECIDKRGDLVLRFKIVDDSLKDPPMEKEISLSLEQIYYGHEEKMNIPRTIVDRKGIEITELKSITLKIPAGTESGKKFFKRRVGNHLDPDRIPGDIIFIIRELKHAQFTRNGKDLEFIASITVNDAKHGCDLQIPTIDGDIRKLILPKKYNIDIPKTIKNVGMPILQQANKRGNLIVRFNIIHDHANSSFKADSKKGNNNKMFDNFQKNSNTTKLNNQIKNDEPIEYDIPVSLEDILHGCTKRMRIKRIVGREFDEIATIKIAPGTMAGKRFKFEKAKFPNIIAADITFVLVEEKHHAFTRFEHHLQYTANITEEQANGCELDIPTLEGKPMAFKIIKPLSNLEETRKIPSRGLPHLDNPSHRGDIIINFNIVKGLKKDANVNKTKYSDQNQQMSQNPPLYINTYYHLEQILTGYNDSFSLQLPYTSEDGTVKLEQRSFEIYIQPGMKNGTKFPFPQQGDNKKGIHSTNVVFVATLIRHKYFRRLGLDIVYTAKVSNKIALEGGNIQVPTLEGEILSISLKSQLNPKKSMDIPDRGLPYIDDNTKRGKLIIWFEITEDENAIMKFIGKAINYLPQIMGP